MTMKCAFREEDRMRRRCHEDGPGVQTFLNCDFKFKLQHWPNTVREKEHLEMVLCLGCYFPIKVGITVKEKKKKSS